MSAGVTVLLMAKIIFLWRISKAVLMAETMLLWRYSLEGRTRMAEIIFIWRYCLVENIGTADFFLRLLIGATRPLFGAGLVHSEPLARPRAVCDAGWSGSCSKARLWS